LILKISTPAFINPNITSFDDEAGPSVAIIFVFFKYLFIILDNLIKFFLRTMYNLELETQDFQGAKLRKNQETVPNYAKYIALLPDYLIKI
jgi:hypothetical protein